MTKRKKRYTPRRARPSVAVSMAVVLEPITTFLDSLDKEGKYELVDGVPVITGAGAEITNALAYIGAIEDMVHITSQRKLDVSSLEKLRHELEDQELEQDTIDEARKTVADIKVFMSRLAPNEVRNYLVTTRARNLIGKEKENE